MPRQVETTGGIANPVRPCAPRGRLWDVGCPFEPSRVPIFYGWVVLAAATLGVVASIPGQTMGVSVFTEVLLDELGLGRVQLSLAYLVGTVASGLLVAWGGRMFDRHGARKTIVVAAGLFGVVLIMMSQIDRLAKLLAAPFVGPGEWGVPFAVITAGFFAIRFLGQGMLTVTSRSMLGKWFDKRRGLAMAINGVIVSFAFSSAPKFLDELMVVFGWRGAYVFLGLAVGVGMGLTGWALFRDNPEECGLKMDGGTVRRRLALEEAPDVRRDWDLREALRTPAFWAFNLGTAWFSLLTTAYAFHVLSVGAHAGVSRSDVLALFIPMAAVGVVSNFLAGWLSDRIAMKGILFALLGSLVAASLGMLWLSLPVGRALAVLGVGMAGGFFQTCIGVTWPRFFGRTHVGAISGFNMSTIVIASALGPFLFSLSERLAGDYQAAFLLSAFVPPALAVPAWFARNPQR